MADMTTDDVSQWAERRLEKDSKRVARGNAAPAAPGEEEEEVVEAEAEGEMTDELLDAIVELAQRVLALMGEWPEDMLVESAEPSEEKAAGNPEEDRQLSPEKKAEIQAEIGRMPEALQSGFKKWLKAEGESPVSWEKAQELASDIASKREGQIDDPERFGAWLYWASKA